jgi:hypothetical protein
MANNTAKYGFRFVRSRSGGTNLPTPIEMAVADSYQATSDGAASNVDLNIGDPVLLVSTGTVGLATTTADVWGVIVGFKPYWNGTAMTPTNRLPGGTTGGSNITRQSRVLVVPVENNIFEVDVDDNTTATTYAGYQAFIGENADHVCVADLTNTSRPKANPKLDISVHATTNTLGWRIVGISDTAENQDFSGTGVKLLVMCNNIQVFDGTHGNVGTGV